MKIWTRPTNKNSWSLNKQEFVQKSKLKNLNLSLFYPLIPDLHVMPFLRYMNVMTSFSYMNMCHDVRALMLATQERRSPEEGSYEHSFMSSLGLIFTHLWIKSTSCWAELNCFPPSSSVWVQTDVRSFVSSPEHSQQHDRVISWIRARAC